MILVTRAYCPNDRGGHTCNADLSNLALAACKGKAASLVTVRCPFCHAMVGISLDWQIVSVADRPVMATLVNGGEG